jgi:hypothetical protein
VVHAASEVLCFTFHLISFVSIRGRIQKFPERVDNEICNYKTERVMAAKLARLTHKRVIQLHLVAESCTICSSRSRRQVRKFLETL